MPPTKREHPPGVNESGAKHVKTNVNAWASKIYGAAKIFSWTSMFFKIYVQENPTLLLLGCRPQTKLIKYEIPFPSCVRNFDVDAGEHPVQMLLDEFVPKMYTPMQLFLEELIPGFPCPQSFDVRASQYAFFWSNHVKQTTPSPEGT